MNRFGRPLGGCWLAWDPEIAMLTLCYNLHVPAADSISFNNTLDNFLVALDQVREEFSKDNREESQPERHFTPEMSASIDDTAVWSESE